MSVKRKDRPYAFTHARVYGKRSNKKPKTKEGKNSLKRAKTKGKMADFGDMISNFIDLERKNTNFINN